eukprot:c16321_g1_i1 orf=77-256(+)
MPMGVREDPPKVVMKTSADKLPRHADANIDRGKIAPFPYLFPVVLNIMSICRDTMYLAR